LNQHHLKKVWPNFESGKETSVARLVRRRTSFALWEAACLLSDTEIRHENLTGAASMHLHDLKKQILDEKIKPLNGNSGGIALARLAVKMGNFDRADIPNNTEISKDTLRKLAKKLSVEIPGID
jgi:hypothetical protein